MGDSKKQCSVKACDRTVIARGYCGLHWQRWRKGAPLDLPRYHNRENALGWVSAGYRWISTPDGEILEHRYLMEKHLKRKLGVDETVHHINGDKTDNRLSNLEVLSRADHTRHHRSHRGPCLVCGKDDVHGRHGMCANHAARVERFLARWGITLPTAKVAAFMLRVGIGMALYSKPTFERLESLHLEQPE